MRKQSSVCPIDDHWARRRCLGFKKCIRLRKIEIGRKFQNLANQRLRNLASHAKHFFRFLRSREPKCRGPEDAVGFDKNRRSGRFEPAGELSERIGEILGAISRILKILEGFSKKNQGFSRFWKDLQRIGKPQALFSLDFLGFPFISYRFLKGSREVSP